MDKRHGRGTVEIRFTLMLQDTLDNFLCSNILHCIFSSEHREHRGDEAEVGIVVYIRVQRF